MTSENHSYLTSIAVGFAIAITCIALFLRLLARKIQKLPLGADDYVIIVGAIFTIGNAVVFIFSNKYGNGRHLKTLNKDEIINYWKTNYAGYQIYGVAVTLIKISILLFYRRIFVTQQFRMWTNIVGAFVIIWLLVNNFTAAFQCTPIEKAWLVLMPGHCFNPISYITGVHTTNLILDFVILALPISATWRLQMSLGKKISVAGIFLLGAISIVIGIIRLVVIRKADIHDITWYTSICSWTAIEPAVEVLSVSLPTMAPFLHIRNLLATLRTSLRTLFSHQKSQKSDSAGKFHEINKAKKAFPTSESQWTTLAIRGDGEEPVPLQGIKVVERMEWRGDSRV